MGWTTSARWERRTSKEAKALHKHEARDLASPGRGHRNQDIDPARIGDNVVLVSDEDGRLIPSTEPGDWARAIDRNLARVKGARYDEAEDQWYDEVTIRGKKGERKRRTDKTEVMDAVLQLDPDFTGPIVAGHYPVYDDAGHVRLDENGEEITQWHDDMTPEKREECQRLLMAMVGTFAVLVGPRNIVGVAIQWDETHPHVHLQLTPISEDGKLDWKTFIDGPVATSRFHDKIRLDLQAEGYDATMERVTDGAKHLGQEKFKARKDHERAERAALAKDRAGLSARVAELDERQADLDATEAALDTRAATLAAQAQNLTARGQRLDSALAELPALRRRARDEGRAEGLAEADDLRQQATADAAAAALERQRAEQDRRQAAGDAQKAAHARLRAEDAEERLQSQVDRLGPLEAGAPAKVYDQPDMWRRFVNARPEVGKEFEDYALEVWAKRKKMNLALQEAVQTLDELKVERRQPARPMTPVERALAVDAEQVLGDDDRQPE